MPLPLTDKIARAAAADVADRRRRKAGRSAWSRSDYNTAVKAFNKLTKTTRKDRI